MKLSLLIFFNKIFFFPKIGKLERLKSLLYRRLYENQLL